jgi:hypothetical protein
MLYQDAPNANIGDQQTFHVISKYAASKSEARPLPSHCSNCSASLDGPFCAHCGQAAVLSRPRTALMRFIHAKHQRPLSPESCSNWHVF